MIGSDRAVLLASLAFLLMGLLGCGPPPQSTLPSPTPAAIVLEHGPDGVCRLGAAHPVTFRIDPQGPEPVYAVDDRGRVLRVYWSPGFVPGTADDPVVRDPDGQVVARDGERLTVPAEGSPKLHGYTVCFGRGIYVLLNGPE